MPKQPESPDALLKRLRSELRQARADLAALNELYQRVCEVTGFNPQTGEWAGELPYGWTHHWTHPLYDYLNQTTSPEIRNHAVELMQAALLQLAVLGKYGIQLPHEPRSVDAEAFAAKQQRIFVKAYLPCAICGEARITHECHIIPRAEGGPDHADNYVMLCPLHHHLFDHHRLTREEWTQLERALADKMESARQYATEIHFIKLQTFWEPK